MTTVFFIWAKNVGQCSGAGRFDRAKDYLKFAVILGAGFIAAMILKSIFGLSGVWMGFLLSHIVSVIFALIIFRLNSNENAIVDIKCSEA